VSAQSFAATVTVNVQFAELFEASVAVQVTVVVPVGKLDPDGGLQETTGSSGVEILLGQITEGAVVSLPVTTTLKLQEPPPAVLQLTTVVPIGNAEPE